MGKTGLLDYPIAESLASSKVVGSLQWQYPVLFIFFFPASNIRYDWIFLESFCEDIYTEKSTNLMLTSLFRIITNCSLRIIQRYVNKVHSL